MNITVQKTSTPKAKPQDESALGFGRVFTDHMFLMDYSVEKGWHAPRIESYHNFSMDPATMVLHYSQTIFEGLKAYHLADGGINLFRPMDNFVRMLISCDRLCIPRFDENIAMEGLKMLIDLDKDWVPKSEGTSLYIRPTLIATDPFVGVRASNTYTFYIILSPVGAYYAGGLSPTSIYVEDEQVRAVTGGLGYVKAGANYAASLLAAHQAHEKGFDQVLWLDGIEHKYIEEVGSMNMFFLFKDGLVTPKLNGSILPGITRASVMALAQSFGVKVTEKRLSIQDVFEAHEKGDLLEAFGTGTAAVISPVGKLIWEDKTIILSETDISPFAQRLYDQLTGMQYGRISDPFGWTVRL